LQSVTFRQAYSDVHSAEDIEAYRRNNYTIEKAVAVLDSGDTACCVGLIDSEPSGYYIVKHQASSVAPELDSSELKQIYIINSAYGSGLGGALYDHALETIRSAGNRSVWLCVSDINHRAQSFYKKLGFKLAGIGPALEVGEEKLSSSILINEV
jgi:ribosomal protein S18 acetylase RimI-like enzyme